jgi:hypothetical protein
MKEFKIYCLKDPDTMEIRYIGVTTSKYISRRLSQHNYCANNNYQTHVAKWIRKIGKSPIIELIEICNKDNWEEKEIYWINYYDNLTNIHEGGKGVIIDRKFTSIERSAKAHNVKIVQLDNDGNLIKIWNSIKDATIYFNGKSKSSICNVLKNNYGAVTAFGYRWFYYNDYINNNYTIKDYKSKVNYDNINKVYLYDLENNLIEEFKSLNLLVKKYKTCYTTAFKALKKQYKYLNKYKIRNYKI